jgi:predicted RNA-binding protein with TRAM domain
MADSEKRPPIRVDDEVDVEIESRGARSDGVAKYDGFIIFIPNTSVGEKVKVKVEKVFKKFAIGRRMLVSEDDIIVTKDE